MIAIFRKELAAFFNAPIGYLIVSLFLVLNGLFLWVFRNNFNILDYGFADLSNFFLLTPWIFIFMIPAIAMRSFSEEKKTGTLELLLIKPISKTKLVLGKFFGNFAVALIALLPSILYIFAISDLGVIEGNYDSGIVLGSYFGLFFLLGLYCSLGILASSLSDNQIFAFVLGAALCFLVFYGPEASSTLFSDGTTQLWLRDLGAKAHFEDIARGVLDTRDIVYFLSLTVFVVILIIKQLLNQTTNT